MKKMIWMFAFVSLSVFAGLSQTELEAFVEWWTGVNYQYTSPDQLPYALEQWFMHSSELEIFAAWWTGNLDLNIQFFAPGLVGVSAIAFKEYTINFSSSTDIVWRIFWSRSGSSSKFSLAPADTSVQIFAGQKPAKILLLYAPLSSQTPSLTFTITAP